MTEHNNPQDNVTLPRAVVHQVVDATFSPYCLQDLAKLVPILRTALEQPAVEPSGYLTDPITWKSERFHSEQLVKVTQHRQPEYGYVHPVYTTAPQAQQPAVEHEHMGTVRSKSGGGVFVQWNVQPKAGMKLYTAPPSTAPQGCEAEYQ